MPSNCKHFPDGDDHCLVCEKASRPTLATLRQAIIDNSTGDLFWIGEILLAELEKETGFNGSSGSVQ